MKKLFTTTALVLSLAFSGTGWANDATSHEKSHHDGSPRYMKEALSKLPKDKAALFEDSIKKAREQNKTLQDQAKTLREELRALLTAPKFDKDAYIAKSAEIQQLQAKAHANKAAAFAGAATQLTQDERKTLSDAIHHRGQGKGKEHGREYRGKNKDRDDHHEGKDGKETGHDVPEPSGKSE